MIAGIADKGSLAPLDMAVIEQHILPFASVILAVHRLDILPRRVGIVGAVAINSIVAVSSDGVLCRGRWGMLEIPYAASVEVSRWILVGEGIAERAAPRMCSPEIRTLCRRDLLPTG